MTGRNPNGSVGVLPVPYLLQPTEALEKLGVGDWLPLRERRFDHEYHDADSGKDCDDVEQHSGFLIAMGPTVNEGPLPSTVFCAIAGMHV